MDMYLLKPTMGCNIVPGSFFLICGMTEIQTTGALKHGPARERMATMVNPKPEACAVVCDESFYKFRLGYFMYL